MAVFSSAPALACFTVNGKSATRTATAPHAMVAHQGKPVVACAASSAAAVTPTGSKPLVDAASCSAALSLRVTVWDAHAALVSSTEPDVDVTFEPSSSVEDDVPRPHHPPYAALDAKPRGIAADASRRSARSPRAAIEHTRRSIVPVPFARTPLTNT